jgi:preprotein translocase subunit YajC
VDLLVIVLIGFALMWVVLILPQRRRASAHARMLEDLEAGDQIVTAGGLYGRVRRIGDEDVTVELAPGVEVRLARRAVAGVVEDGTGEAERSADVRG